MKAKSVRESFDSSKIVDIPDHGRQNYEEIVERMLGVISYVEETLGIDAANELVAKLQSAVNKGVGDGQGLDDIEVSREALKRYHQR